MKSVAFPNCCTARVIYDFGGTPVSGCRTETISKKKLEEEFEQQFKYYKDMCIVAITNNQQRNINQVLKESKFKCGKWMRKDAHSETKIRIWWREPDVKK